MFDPLDIIGRRFSRLLVSEYVGKTGSRHKYSAVCDCGSIKVVARLDLKSGHTSSCGCYRKQVAWKNRVTHGHTVNSRASPEHRAWWSMIERCENEDHAAFHNYGGRGISVCERWRTSFVQFLEDVGDRPGVGYSLDRINNDGNYEPGNVRWATRTQQARNTRHTLNLSYDGRSQCLSDWAREIGISKNALSDRLKRGWSIEKALTTPRRHMKC